MRQLSPAAKLLAASLSLVTGIAAAQPSGVPAAPPAAAPAAQPPGAPAAQPAAATRLTPDQLATFSRIVGAPDASVSGRMQADPRLAAMALPTNQARASRKATGKAMVIGGATILVLGDIIGAAMIMSAPGYPTVAEKDRGQVNAGLAVALLSAAAGLAIGIPGIVKLTKPSDEEREAQRYYRQAVP